ncbi:MAG: hypothetical protein ACRDZX_08825 [Acidimicrobiales bacterium]
MATRSVAVLAVLAASSCLVTACGGGQAHNGVANVGHAKVTSTQSTAAAASGSSGQSGATEAQLLKYAVCMRAHGYPTMPDPVPAQGGGYAFMGYGTPGGIDPNSPQYKSAARPARRTSLPASRT